MIAPMEADTALLFQGELRVAKENSRRMEDRMRGILKERTELVRT